MLALFWIHNIMIFIIQNKNYIFYTQRVIAMFKKKDEHGIVGADKNADRQIIVWITYNILQAIKNGTSLKDLEQLTILAPESIYRYPLNDAYRVWHGVSLPNICTKFIRAYNSKLFSKSKKYVLPYFKAVENILSEKDPDKTLDLLNDLATACNRIVSSFISNKKALFTNNKNHPDEKDSNQFWQAMAFLYRGMVKLTKTLSERASFSKTLTNLLEEVESSNFWDEISGLSGRLENLATCFATAYLDTENLKIEKVEFENELPGNCVLRAYPVLVSIYQGLKNSEPGADILADIKAFLAKRRDALYDVLEKPDKYPEHKYDADCSEIYNLLYTIK